jgi:hypothetical protein
VAEEKRTTKFCNNAKLVNKFVNYGQKGFITLGPDLKVNKAKGLGYLYVNIGLAKQPRSVLLKVTWLASLMEMIRLKWNIVVLLDSTSGNTKGGSITVLLTSCLIVFESAAWQLTIYIFICKTD